jgi:hypothetical protein
VTAGAAVWCAIMLNNSIATTRRRTIELIIAITVASIGVWLAP